MTSGLGESKTTWAEDKALPRGNLSAVPGAKTGSRIALGRAIRPVRTPFRDWSESEKPSRQDAAKSPTGGLLPFTNANSPQFHFPLNQHT